MKMKIAMLACLALALITTNAFAHIGNVRPHGATPEVIVYDSVSEEMFKEITAGLHPDVVIEFPKGEEVSLSFEFTGTLFSLDTSNQTPLTLTVLQHFYMRNSYQGFQFSTDMKVWKIFSEFFVGMLHSHLDLKESQALTKLQFEVYPAANR